MAPIPVYTDSPVAAKPSNVTPQTAAPEESQSAAPATTTATATVSATPTTPYYPQAQPGATPTLPVPSAAAQAYASPTQPTLTQQLPSGGPPPPQAGATPMSSTTKPHLPPPPKAGEKFVPPPQAPTPIMPYPAQMSIPPPTMAYPAQQQGTATAAASSLAYGQGPGNFIGQGGQNLEHPLGYHQNVNASGLDKYQTSPAQRNVMGDGHDHAEEGMWDTAKKWVSATGEKLAAAENEVWKRINKE
ncbi:uncharacterized protein BCR38DRAFT_405429 [Pseudomassariella vexata]|uniref:Uncharacterized protein n=1 Tax=Pseudomassariella vexata TaxID=1141098 RepID=A0A1Y2EDU1_9PEZI|nr:uncharacterized protein BCR38DRAFT_405429 [Pseudomassariella vexata]ORY69748.1 hypothetical protein BCR38DRAFT_405429 [Pseudomassariella vexata]